MLRAYAGPVGFWLEATIPVGLWISSDATGEVPDSYYEGVVYGARSHNWERVPFEQTWGIDGGVQVRFGGTYMDFGVATTSAVRRLGQLAWPYIAIHWRL